MTIRKGKRKKNEKPFLEAVTDLLLSSMANHEDFVVTYEKNALTGKKEIHVMSGNLITEEALASMKAEVARQLEDGGRHHVRDME
jgi:hypothetical protein